jgi:uncharacterized protein (DUF2147 family)
LGVLVRTLAFVGVSWALVTPAAGGIDLQVHQRGKIKLYYKSLAFIAGTVLLLATAAVRAQQPAGLPPDPTGEWLVAKRVAQIRVVNCGARFWGLVSWETTPGIDSKNPDPNLRGRPTLGMPILLGMVQTKLNLWSGSIYNAQDGHTYSASISLVDPDTLRVQGCFLGFLCGGENWSRVPPPVPLPPPKPAKNRAAARPPAAAAPEPDETVCLRLLGTPGLAH